MDVFDAIVHSFSTVGIGGFSTYDASIGHFNSTAIEMICAFFMLLVAINYSLHFYAWKRKSVVTYRSNRVLRFFLQVLGISALIVIAPLWITQTYDLPDDIRYGNYQLITIVTTSSISTAK